MSKAWQCRATGRHALFAEGDKTMHYILMCRSLTLAQRAARVLQRAGMFAAVTKAPQSANPGGCTYGVKIAQRNLSAALTQLEQAGIQVLKVLEQTGPGGGGVQR